MSNRGGVLMSLNIQMACEQTGPSKDLVRILRDVEVEHRNAREGLFTAGGAA